VIDHSLAETRSLKRVVLVGVVGLLIGAAYALRVLIPDGLDPSALAAFGEESELQNRYATELLGEIHLRSDLGHDGKFYFIQANDPLYLDVAQHATYIDRPVYRAQRMFYPLLAGGFGLLTPTAVVWSMIIVNVAALGMGTAATAKLALGRGASPWLGLAFTLNLGMLAELGIGGAGIVAFALAMLGVVAAERSRWVWATVWFTASVLAREVMLLFVAGALFAQWRRTGRIRWKTFLVPAAAAGLWRLYIVTRIGHLPELVNQEVVSTPFSGLLQATTRWMSDPLNLVIIVVIAILIVLTTIRTVRTHDMLAWGSVALMGLTPFLSANVWGNWYDIARAVAPAFTAYVFLLFAPQLGLGKNEPGASAHVGS